MDKKQLGQSDARCYRKRIMDYIVDQTVTWIQEAANRSLSPIGTDF